MNRRIGTCTHSGADAKGGCLAPNRRSRGDQTNTHAMALKTKVTSHLLAVGVARAGMTTPTTNSEFFGRSQRVSPVSTFQ